MKDAKDVKDTQRGQQKKVVKGKEAHDSYTFDDIFPEELEIIKKRREAKGIDTSDIENQTAPSDKLGLVGLALSGGGIRSATFSLGVVQGLIKRGLFQFADYVSTVSGGGYLGSCISSLLNKKGEKETVLRAPGGSEDTEAIKHLRNSSNYLTPPGILNKLRLPLLVVRGIFLNFFLVIPYIILAVILTEMSNELVYPYLSTTGFFSVIISLCLMVLLMVLYPFAMKLFKFGWGGRNKYDLLLTTTFSLLFFFMLFIMVLKVVSVCVNYSFEYLAVTFFNNLQIQHALLTILVAMVVLMFTSFRKYLLNIVVGILGPLFVFCIYLFLCVFFIESPFLSTQYGRFLDDLDKTGKIKQSAAATAITPAEGGKVKLRKQRSITSDPDYIPFRKLLKEQELLHPNLMLLSIMAEKTNYEPRAWTVSLVYLVGSGLTSRLTSEKVKIEDKGYALFIAQNSIFRGHLSWWLYVAGLAMLLLNFLFLDVNITSMHGFYRDRLSKAYIIRRSGGDGESEDGSESGNCREEDEGCNIRHEDTQKMSGLNAEGTFAPYHLINAAMNVPKSTDPDLRGRNTDFFTFSKLYSGSHLTGYCKTSDMEEADRSVNLGTAMAISAAAASPSMGTMTLSYLTFIMTLLNIRLNYWVPNPKYVCSSHDRLKGLKRFLFTFAGPKYLLKEIIGDLCDRSIRVNLSDGGHIENLAIYQLLKRRCRLIIAVDGEADPKMNFKGLSTLLRYAKIDMGIDIDIDLEPLRKDPEGISRRQWVMGDITYPARRKSGAGSKPEKAKLLYIKLSIDGDENEYIKAYRREHPDYPHQSTADQFFSESQFEVYRALGEKITDCVFDDTKGAGQEENLSPSATIVKRIKKPEDGTGDGRSLLRPVGGKIEGRKVGG